MSLISEIKRRNVLRMAALYLGSAWLIMQVVDLLIDRGPLPESLGPITLMVLAIGLPIALILSWFYEITPEGVTLDENIRAGEAQPVRGQRLNSVVIAVMAAALLLFAYDKWWTGPPPVRSVAVLPFDTLSTDAEAMHLGSGVADTILNMLVTIPDLHVASRTSSFQPRLEGLSVPEIAALLGVTAVLEGSVQRQGDKLRITAQLIDAETDNHLWSQIFDRDYMDLFDIQDEIAEAVASALELSLLSDSRQRIDREETDNLAAFEEYSKAMENLRVRTFDSVPKAAEQLQRAIELDPDFARAHALLGHVYLSTRYGASTKLNEQELAERARESAKSALKIAPGMSMALTVLGNVTVDVDAKGELYREAVANGPNDEFALQAYARYLSRVDNLTDEPIELAERLVELDPLDEKHHWLLAQLQTMQFKIPEALATIARGKQKVPDSIELRDMEAFCHFEIGNYAEAIVAKYETLAIDPKEFINRWSIATLYLLVDMPDEAELWFERAAETAPEKFRSGMQLIHRTMLDVYYLRNDEEVFAAFHHWPPFSFGLEQRGVYEIFIEYGVRLGRMDEVLVKFEQLSPHLFTVPPTPSPLDGIDLYGTTLALLRNGEAEKAEPLVRAAFEWINARKEAGFYTSPLVADLLLAQGKTAEALESFRQYVANNKFFISGNGAQFLYRNSSLYDPIRGEPEFIGLLADYDQNAKEQRELLQSMDLPIK